MPLLIGAADQLQEATSRLQSMSPQQRTEIAETLRRFDLQSPEQQKAIRELDEQIRSFPPRSRLTTWPCSGDTTTGWTLFPTL